MHVVCLDYDFSFTSLWFPSQTDASACNCSSFSVHDPATTVSPFATQEDFHRWHTAVSQTTTQLPLSLQSLSGHAAERGERMIRKTNWCVGWSMMTAVFVEYLYTTFLHPSLSALFFLLPSPSFLSPFLLPAPLFRLFLSGSNQSLAQTLSYSRKGFWCSEQLFLPHGVGLLSNLRLYNLSESSSAGCEIQLFTFLRSRSRPM